MPALAQTKPWWVSTISTPRSARSTSRLSSRISSTRAGSLPSDRGEAARLARRASHRGERRTRPSALETTFCEMTRTSPSRSSARRGDLAADAHPLARTPAGRRPPTRMLRPLAHMPSALAVRRARPRARPPAPGSGRRRRPGCRGRAPARAAPRPPKGMPASRAAATWRAQLPSPKAGAIAPGGASARALVPVPWRSGTIADVARGQPGQQAVELTRVEQRAVAGEQDDAGRARRLGARDPGQRRLDVAARRRGRGRPRRRPPAASSCGARVAADDDRALDRARLADRLQHVVEHRRHQRRAPLAVDAGGEALLRRGEALHREDRGRLQPAGEARRRSRARCAPAGRGRPRPPSAVGAARVGISLGGGSGSPSSTTIASISPA